jgi:glycosyltransferase involved in cell wall biosynthesis
MKVSVVIPAYNEEKLLAATLASVRAAARSFDALGWATQLIVCDNNSTDATAEVARQNGATVVFEPVNQIARARNAGAAAATGDWLVFVDADSRPSPELFAEAASQIQSGGCLAGGCVVRMDEHHFVAGALTGLWNLTSRACHWFAGSFSFCETRAFRAVGGFNEHLYASEELDLSQRLNKLARREGKKKLVILHRHPLLTSARKMKLYSRGELLRFMGRAVFRPRRTVASRDACSPWYDGRR